MAVTDKIMLNADRIIKLTPMEGTLPATSSGMLDSRLFTGENKLHVIKDPETCFWSFKYDAGVVPPVLKQNFTSFTAAFKFAKDYFKKRNVELMEIFN